MTIQRWLKNYFNRKIFDTFDHWYSWYNVSKFLGKWTGYDFIRYDVIQPIIRVAQWIPVLWYNFDWDGSYFMKMVCFKLTRMEKSLRNGHGVLLDPKHPEYNDEAFVKQRNTYFKLVEARDLAKKIVANTYWEDYEKMFKKHYGGYPKFIDRISEKNAKGLRTWNMVEDWSSVNKEKLEIAKKVNKRFSPIDYEYWKHKQETDKLFDIIKENLRNWWD